MHNLSRRVQRASKGRVWELGVGRLGVHLDFIPNEKVFSMKEGEKGRGKGERVLPQGSKCFAISSEVIL